MKTFQFDSLPSTSDYIKENYYSLPIPCVVCADKQTAGRGRQGKSFYSPDKTGLYFSILTKMPSNSALVTADIAVCVCRAIEKLTDLNPKIKWVNDIFVDNKKVCGILCESFSRNSVNYLCTGIGINITTNVFPAELSNAGSLGILLNKDLLRDTIVKEILFNKLNDNQIVSEYSTRMLLNNKIITYSLNNKAFSGKVEGIDNLCRLIVSDINGNNVVLSSGEINIQF